MNLANSCYVLTFFDYYVTSIQLKIASWTLITTTSFDWDFIGRCYLTTVTKHKNTCVTSSKSDLKARKSILTCIIFIGGIDLWDRNWLCTLGIFLHCFICTRMDETILTVIFTHFDGVLFFLCFFTLIDVKLLEEKIGMLSLIVQCVHMSYITLNRHAVLY